MHDNIYMVSFVPATCKVSILNLKIDKRFVFSFIGGFVTNETDKSLSRNS